ncbi:MAG: 30S ribosomal protein S8e [Candidatus Thermoplasmatota archaeon]|nr:30S ribosomal protein S8e [Candidatus Thermoplasmatota archaeon]MBS3789446.1 30S ribosomal protein S8e [Candidatus Thermoplasmatota archaeon]
MTHWQGKSKRKLTGGKRVYHRKKRKFEISSDYEFPVLAEEKKKIVKSRGGNQKIRVVGAEKANISDKEGNVKQVEINNVIENPANPNYVQRNILNRGAIIETDEGKAKITSRPGQDGVINAVLIED